MHNFHCFAASMSRRAAETIEALLQKMNLVEQSLPHPAAIRIRATEMGAARVATSLDSAKRAYVSNTHALSSTDALLKQLYR